MAAINSLVGGGMYLDSPGVNATVGGTGMVGSAADYLPAAGSSGKVHLNLAALISVAIITLVAFQIGGFRAMVAVGR